MRSSPWSSSLTVAATWLASFLLLGCLPVGSYADEPQTADVTPQMLVEIPRMRSDRLVVSPDGASFVVADQGTSMNSFSSYNLPQPGKSLRVYRAADGHPLFQVDDGWLKFEYLAGGRYLAVFSEVGAQLFAIETGQPIALPGSQATISLDVLPDGKTVVGCEVVFEQELKKLLFGMIPSNTLCQVWFQNLETGQRMATAVDALMPLYCPVVSADGKYLVGQPVDEDDEGNLKPGPWTVWEVATGKVAADTEKSNVQLRGSEAFLKQGHTLICQSKDPKVRLALWDVESGKTEKAPAWLSFFNWTSMVNGYRVGVTAGSPRQAPRQISYWEKDELVVSDFATCRELVRLDLTSQIDRDRMLLTGPQRQEVNLVDVHDNEALTITIPEPKRHEITIWDRATGQTVRTIGVPDRVDDIQTSSDGRTMAVRMIKFQKGYPDRSCYVVLYDLTSGKLLRKLDLADEHDMKQALFSGDGKRLVTAEMFPEPAQETENLETLNPQQRMEARMKASRRIREPWLTQVNVWEVATGKKLQTIDAGQRDITDLAISPDGNQIAATSDESKRNVNGFNDGSQSRIDVWDANTGEVLQSIANQSAKAIPFMTGAYRQLAFLPDGKRLAVQTEKGYIALFEIDGGKLDAFVNCWASSGNCFQFTPDGERLLMRNHGSFGEVTLEAIRNSPRNLTQPVKIVVDNAASGPAAISHDGKNFASGSFAGEIQAFGTDRPGDSELYVQQAYQHALAFSADAKWLISGGEVLVGYQTNVFDRATGERLTSIPLDLPPSYSADGQLTASPRRTAVEDRVQANPDGTKTFLRDLYYDAVTFWETKSGRKIAEVPCLQVRSIELLPGGDKAIFSTSEAFQVWDISAIAQQRPITEVAP